MSYHLLPAPDAPGPRVGYNGGVKHPAPIGDDFLGVANAIHKVFAMERQELTMEELPSALHAAGLNRRTVTSKARSADELDPRSVRLCIQEYVRRARRPIIYNYDDAVWREARTRGEAVEYAKSLWERAESTTKAAAFLTETLARPEGQQLRCLPHRRDICRTVMDCLPSSPANMTAERIADHLNDEMLTTSHFYERGKGKPWDRDNVRKVIFYLREIGARICSDNDSGYWLGSDDDIRDTIAHQESRVQAIREYALAIKDATEFTMPRQGAEWERVQATITTALVPVPPSATWRKYRDPAGRVEARQKALNAAHEINKEKTPWVDELQGKVSKGYKPTDAEMALVKELDQARELIRNKGRRPSSWGPEAVGPHDPLIY